MNLLGITGVGADHTLLVGRCHAEQALQDLSAHEGPGLAQHDVAGPAARAGGIRGDRARREGLGVQVREDRLDARPAAEGEPDGLRRHGTRLRGVQRDL